MATTETSQRAGQPSKFYKRKGQMFIKEACQETYSNIFLQEYLTNTDYSLNVTTVCHSLHVLSMGYGG